MARVAVVGGGMAGVVAALAVAESGHLVHLYEREPGILRGASRACEGKVHLGYVYAADRTGRTARMMMQGAAAFTSVLSRWVPAADLEGAASPPFLYAVPRDSMVPVAAVEEHFATVARRLDEHPVVTAQAGMPAYQRLTPSECAEHFDPAQVAAVFRTNEIAIDPFVLADRLGAAVRADERIDVRAGTTVTRLRVDGTAEVTSTGPDGTHTADYACVVNASWESRIGLDATAGLDPSRPVIHRFKVGVSLPAAAPLPTVTFLVGEYGDTVVFRDRAYASWYPSGLLASVIAPAPPPAAEVLAGVSPADLAEATLTGLAALMPAAVGLRPLLAEAELTGGWITAWGRSGIDDPASQLHERFDVGVHVHGPLVSVDTGKLTTAPLFGVRAAAEVLRIIGPATAAASTFAS